MGLSITENRVSVKHMNRIVNNVGTCTDEMAHYEPSCLDLHCLQRYVVWSAGLKWLILHTNMVVFITGTCLFKYIVNFTTKNESFQMKNSIFFFFFFFHIFLLKT